MLELDNLKSLEIGMTAYSIIWKPDDPSDAFSAKGGGMERNVFIPFLAAAEAAAAAVRGCCLSKDFQVQNRLEPWDERFPLTKTLRR